MQRATKQWKSQWQTLQHFPVKTDSNIAVDEYNVIVDALFGVGLSRPVEGSYADAVEEMNMVSVREDWYCIPVRNTPEKSGLRMWGSDRRAS